MYYIKPDGTYYEGDQADLHDQVVPQRPDDKHVLTNGLWVVSQVMINKSLLSQISELESKSLMNRATREFMILIAEQQGTALGITSAQLYLVNPAYKAVKDIDTQIVTIRSQIV